MNCSFMRIKGFSLVDLGINDLSQCCVFITPQQGCHIQSQLYQIGSIWGQIREMSEFLRQYILSHASLIPGMVGLAPKWVRLAPNGTNPGLFQIRFQCIWRPLSRVIPNTGLVAVLRTILSLCQHLRPSGMLVSFNLWHKQLTTLRAT